MLRTNILRLYFSGISMNGTKCRMNYCDMVTSWSLIALTTCLKTTNLTASFKVLLIRFISCLAAEYAVFASTSWFWTVAHGSFNNYFENNLLFLIPISSTYRLLHLCQCLADLTLLILELILKSVCHRCLSDIMSHNKSNILVVNTVNRLRFACNFLQCCLRSVLSYLRCVYSLYIYIYI